ncbi:MAG: hypothetical protein FJ395_06520 [Verrucomicrobia bacterium]|nr:hypothetical protein [Verrucomicrobiota bacterium]
MAMIQCPECKKQVSNEADKCPNCGIPIKRGLLGKAGTERVINVGCLVILLVLVAIGILTCL